MSGYFRYGGGGGGGGGGVGTMTNPYTQSFTVGDWVLQGDGSYKIVIPGGTHGKAPTIHAETYILDGADYDVVSCATEVETLSLNVELTVLDTEDRFAGRVLVYGAN